MMGAINKAGLADRKYPEMDSLFFKFQGPTPSSLAETASITRTICEKYGGSGFELAGTDKESTALWADRKAALWSGLALREGARGWSTDVW